MLINKSYFISIGLALLLIFQPIQAQSSEASAFDKDVLAVVAAGLVVGGFIGMLQGKEKRESRGAYMDFSFVPFLIPHAFAAGFSFRVPPFGVGYLIGACLGYEATKN